MWSKLRIEFVDSHEGLIDRSTENWKREKRTWKGIIVILKREYNEIWCKRGVLMYRIASEEKRIAIYMRNVQWIINDVVSRFSPP